MELGTARRAATFFFVWVIGIWNLEFIWNLVLGIWDFVHRVGQGSRAGLRPAPTIGYGIGHVSARRNAGGCPCVSDKRAPARGAPTSGKIDEIMGAMTAPLRTEIAEIKGVS